MVGGISASFFGWFYVFGIPFDGLLAPGASGFSDRRLSEKSADPRMLAREITRFIGYGGNP